VGSKRNYITNGNANLPSGYREKIMILDLKRNSEQRNSIYSLQVDIRLGGIYETTTRKK
jgi:hypothetical protein